jgi:hypothetical protein
MGRVSLFRLTQQRISYASTYDLQAILETAAFPTKPKSYPRQSDHVNLYPSAMAMRVTHCICTIPRNEAIATKTLVPVLSLLLFETNDGLMTPPPFKFQLPDSGLLVGGNYPSGINADCSGVVIVRQGFSNGLDLSNGDDSDGKAGFSYTKLDVDGNDLSASAVSWSCVRDNIIGFIWEIKTDDGDVRDKDNKYFWGGHGRRWPQRCISTR